MKKYLLLPAALLLAGLTAQAQSAMDGFTLSQPGLYGTARFMSMGGAYGAPKAPPILMKRAVP